MFQALISLCAGPGNAAVGRAARPGRRHSLRGAARATALRQLCERRQLTPCTQLPRAAAAPLASDAAHDVHSCWPTVLSLGAPTSRLPLITFQCADRILAAAGRQGHAPVLGGGPADGAAAAGGAEGAHRHHPGAPGLRVCGGVVQPSTPLLHLPRAASLSMAATWAAMAATMQHALQSSQPRAQSTVSGAAQVAWPGSSIQSWIDRGSIAAVGRGVARVAGARLSGASSAAKSFAPSMLRPLRGIPFNSVIWWQGWGA